jgi:hypothetical protein
MRTFNRPLAAICAAVFCFTLQALPSIAGAAETAPNTTISNTASASYSDSNGQSYTTNSNTVTTTVQNAPVLTISSGTAQTVSPGETVTDNFTVTNSGNATGAITLSAPTQSGSATATGYYVLNNAATGTCSVATPCNLATLNSQTALSAAPVGTAITIGVIYQVSSNATTPGTIATTLTGTITQATVGAAPAETSIAAAATDTDTLKADARLDLQKSVTAPTSGTSPISYTIVGNDGGGFGAKTLVSAGNLLGLTNTAGVIAVLDKVPHFTGATTQAALTTAPTVPALPAGDTGTVYYSTSTDGLSAWSTTFDANATYIALFVTTTNAGGIVFPSNPVSGEGAGNVPSATAQFTFTFSTTQPQGNGVSNAGSLSNIANSVIGGNPGNAGTPIIAPGIAVASDYETTTTTFPASTFGPTAANTTAGTSPGTPPGGASNVVTTQAFTSQTALNGPVANAGATGSYNGVAAVSNQNDFTDVSFACSTGSSTNDGTTQCGWPTAGVAVPETIQNSGNGSDTYNIYATAPAGYTVQLYAATGCPTANPPVLPIAPYSTTGCTIGAAISAVSASGGSVTTTAGQSIASNATYNYIVVYKAVAGSSAPFTSVTGDTIAYGSTATLTSGVPTLGTDANETFQTIYPGGPIKVTKSQAIVSNCPGTPAAAAGTVCPGGTITYTLAYANVAPAALANGGAALGTEPAFATNAINIGSGTLTVTDDGTATGSWSASTFGIDATVAPASSTSGTTFTYTPSVALSSGTYPAKTQGPTKIAAQIGGTTGVLVPGASGNVVFQVTVK